MTRRRRRVGIELDAIAPSRQGLRHVKAPQGCLLFHEATRRLFNARDARKDNGCGFPKTGSPILWSCLGGTRRQIKSGKDPRCLGEN